MGMGGLQDGVLYKMHDRKLSNREKCGKITK